MSDITLSASVRQNLLSLQSTSQLLATTQERLATGNKVNSALDNPTNYFTAQSLNNRASDISNLLDSVGNGVQVLQAANTGITSLQKLIDSAKSVANQALQATSGYTQKSQIVSAAITGITANNLLGTNSTVGTAQLNQAIYAPTTVTGTGPVYDTNGNAATATSVLDGAATSTSIDLSALDGKTMTVNGINFTFDATASQSNLGVSGDNTTGYNVDVATDATGTLGDLLTAIETAAGAATPSTAASISATGEITLTSGTTPLTFGGTDATAILTALGGVASIPAASMSPATPAKITGSTLLTGTAGTDSLTSAFTTSDTITVNGKTIEFYDSGAGGSAGHLANTVYLDLNTATVNDVLGAIDLASGVATGDTDGNGYINGTETLTAATGDKLSSVVNGQVVVNSSTASDLVLGGSGLAKLGLSVGTTTASVAETGLSGQTLNFGSFDGGTAVNITFGTATGQVSTLNQLNTALAADNLEASLDSTGHLTISATNDHSSATMTAPTGTAVSTAGAAFNGQIVSGPVKNTDAQNARSSLVDQYNAIIDQITTTAQDASFNGVNLLNGDQLKLVFNETGTSSLNIKGVTDDPSGLGLSKLTNGSDFLDNAATNKVLATLNTASTTLRSQASTLGSNLSIVQIRQDFSNNLINVLQTGASNLTLADTNEEAANSQALS
ncbi:MAG TPA: DUF1522 domain-containing protein, partial [Devosia sp.]|nr:DUF1522 domain-containing protein [Devosia sp.]